MVLRGAPAVATGRPAPATGRPTALQGLLVLVLAVAALRSALWNFSSAQLGATPLLGLAVAAAAATGKVAGGWWARRHRAVAQVSGALAGAVLLLLAPELPLAARLLGVALLQSTLPVGVVLLAELLRGRLALANGVVMGLAVLMGGGTLWLRSPFAGLATGAGLLGAACLFRRYWPAPGAVKPATADDAAGPTPAP
jgi:hypothetical protein